MDSIISWFLMVFLSLIGIIWFINRAETELKRNRKENEDFFIQKRIKDKYEKL